MGYSWKNYFNKNDNRKINSYKSQSIDMVKPSLRVAKKSNGPPQSIQTDHPFDLP